MPKINKVRIANVLYDGKYILDETYKSGGENTLVQLDNGAGKGVLMLLMFQPIIPHIKVGNKNICDFLTTKRPSFVFIEWILDNTPKPAYFLTGIVMIKSRDNYEDAYSKMTYFTFTNSYTQNCNLNIENVPFINPDKDSCPFETFEVCRTIIKNSRKLEKNLEYFSYNDKELYANKLRENGIYQNEWRTIADCNKQETGVATYLMQSNTSDKLFNEWILKTIVKNLGFGDNLHEAFFSLIEEINEASETVKQEEEYAKFSNDFNSYIEKLNDLKLGYEQSEKQQQIIASAYSFLLEYENKKNDEINTYRKNCNQIEKQIANLKYEELSNNYYVIFDKLEKINLSLVYANEEYNDSHKLYSNAKKMQSF